MKKNYFLIFLSIFFLNLTFSQENKLTNKDFKLSLKDCNSSVSFKDKFATFEWDANLIKGNKTIDKVLLEIIPIMDCFNELNATDLKKTIFIDLKKESASKNNKYVVTHLGLSSKCFKWRVRYVGKNKSNITEWNYHLFIK